MSRFQWRNNDICCFELRQGYEVGAPIPPQAPLGAVERTTIAAALDELL
jgi:hypothetical protein